MTVLLLASCSNLTSEVSSPGPQTWFQIGPNYTALLNDSHPSTLVVNVTYFTQPQLLTWKHNGSVIDIDADPRISVSEMGWLYFSSVAMSDSGIYTLEASNGAQCQISQFDISIKCKFLITDYWIGPTQGMQLSLAITRWLLK